jgi:C1A family cysteine protease
MKAANGWIPDFPDFRDYNMAQTKIKEKYKRMQTDSVAAMMEKLGVIDTGGEMLNSTKSKSLVKPKPVKLVLPEVLVKPSLPSSLSLVEYCSPVNNQGDIGSCTAQSAVGMLEYFENRAFGKFTKSSPLFLYKASRNLLKKSGDHGSYIRTTLGALALFGVPPETYWKYDEDKFDEEPTAFCYAFASNYQAINYYRLDTSDNIGNPKELLRIIKTNIKAGLPAIFGFSIYQSYNQSFENGGCIPYPLCREPEPEGHAVMVVGYDDKKKIKNKLYHKGRDESDAEETTGALLIRNSWGRQWGEDGYGWLPYAYVLKRLTTDWWSLLKNEWIDTEQFGL